MGEVAKAFLYSLASLALGFVLFAALLPKGSRYGLIPRLALCLVIGQAAAFLSPALFVYHAVGFILVPALAARREQVVPVFIFSLLTLPFVSAPFAVGGLYLLTLDVSIFLSIGALVALLRFGRLPRPVYQLDLPALLLIMLITIISARDSSSTNYLRTLTASLITLGLPYLVVSRGVRSAEDLRPALVALVAAGASLSALALFETLRSWPLYRIIWQHYGIDSGSGASVKLRGGFLRAPGPYPEPTSFAFSLVLCALPLLALSRAAKHRALLILAPLVGLGLLAPQSRGALLGLLIGLLAFAPGRAGPSLTVRAALIATLGAALYAVQRIVGGGAVAPISADYRSQLLTRGVEEFWKAPVLGRPLAVVTQNLADLRTGEGLVDFVNSYLYVALVGGALGLAVFIGSLGLASVAVLRRARQTVLVSVLGSMMAAILAMLMFTSSTSKNTIVLLVVMGLAAAGLRQPHSVAKSSRAPEERSPAR